MKFQNVNASASPEVQMNDNFETIEYTSVYGKRQLATSGLTWGYWGGRWSGFVVADGTLALTNAAGNYVVALRSTGAISVSTSITNWNDTATYARIYKLTTAGSVVTGVEDHRAGLYGLSGVVPAGSSGSLSGLTAAVGANTIANAAFVDQIWNWAPTVNNKSALTLGETTAASGGTSTSGVPNQVLLKLATLATSTQSPLSIYARGAHALSISPTTGALLAADGDWSQPRYSFASQTGQGLFSASATQLGIAAGSSTYMLVGGSGVIIAPAGSGVTFTAKGTLDLFDNSSTLAMISANHHSNNANPSKIHLLKARGTISAPTVITSGDDLGFLSGFGYLGATNKWVEAARITFDSTGTIADTTSGIGGIIRFSHAKVGTVGVSEVAKFDAQHLIHEGSSPTITAGGGTSPAIVGKDESFTVTVGTGGVATSVEVTFAHPFNTNPPNCVVSSDTDLVSFGVVSTATKVTISATAAFTAGSKLSVVSRGWE